MKAHLSFNLDEVDWREFGGTSKDVFVKDVSTKTFSEQFNTSLFRVKPNGELPKHKHSHAHVLYFLHGEGKLWVGTKTRGVRPGLVALIPSGEEHGYKNTGMTDMMLLVINTPATR